MHDAAGALTVRTDDGAAVGVAEIIGADDAGLRIAAADGTVRIERRIPWRRIVGVETNGEAYSPGELRLALGLAPQSLRPPAMLLPAPAFAPFPPPFPAGPCAPCGGWPRAVVVGRVVGVRRDPMGAVAGDSWGGGARGVGWP